MKFSAYVPHRPPTTNVSYKISRSRMYMSAEGKYWKEQAILLMRCKHNENPQEWQGRFLEVYLTFFDSSIITYDGDGPVKITCDALSEALGFDDRYILSYHITKSKGPSGVFIYLKEMTKEEVEEIGTKWKDLINENKL